MKKIIMALLGAAAISAGSAQAATASGQFDVNITLNSTCTLSTINAVAFTYNSNAAGTVNSTAGGFTVTCTNQLPYSFGLQSGTAAPVGSGNASITVNDADIAITYTLNAPGAGTGSGAAQSLSVGGTIVGPQSGNCATASCANGGTGSSNNRHTLILTY